jgi:hypothetical protein
LFGVKRTNVVLLRFGILKRVTKVLRCGFRLRI